MLPLFAILAFLSCFLFCLLSIVRWTLKNGISPMPSSRKALQTICASLPPEQEGKIYELGSGWGTVLIPLAIHAKRAEVAGYETSPLPFWTTRIRLKWSQLENAAVYRKDFFTVDLSDATVVVCYLYPKAMEALKLKFEKELAPGTLVISNTFAVPGWMPVKILRLNDLYRTPLYFYRP